MKILLDNISIKIERIFRSYQEETSIPKKLDIALIRSYKQNDVQVDKEVFREKINPFIHGWVPGNEDVPLSLISMIISGHLLGVVLDFNLHHTLLRAITYQGFHGLYEIFKHDTKKYKLNDTQKFNLSKARAKYYKGFGDFNKSQKYYRKAIIYGEKINRLSYGLSLKSKLYSDYLQRSGLCFAFSKIAYLRIKENQKGTKYARWHEICYDTYAKELFAKAPEEGKELYDYILENQLQSDNPNSRIKFRYLEANIKLAIRNIDYFKISSYLKEYEETISNIRSNPRAKYVRKLNFISFFRLLEDATYNEIYQKEKEFYWLVKRLKSLKEGDAIHTLNQCLKQSKLYNDSRYNSLILYEKSFWVEDRDSSLSLILLNDALDNFSEDKQSIINKIYCDILNRLGKLYCQKQNWYAALESYQTLYDYLQFLAQKLAKDKSVVDHYINQKTSFKKRQYVELNFLNKEELKEIKDSIITDYEELNQRLINYGKDIKLIQGEMIISTTKIMQNQYNTISHDIPKEIKGLIKILEQFENKKIAPYLVAEISKSKKVLSEKSIEISDTWRAPDMIDLLKPKEIKLNKEVQDHIELVKRSQSRKNINIELIKAKDEIEVEINKSHLKSLLRNLIGNAIHVSKKNKLMFLKITIEIKKIKNNVYITFSDNCGDFSFYKKVINCVNQGKKVPSKKNSDNSGNGLLNSKENLDVFKLNGTWNLTGDDSWKKLEIPLFVFNN